MTFNEFWIGLMLDGKTLNSTEVKLSCHLAWENAIVQERERITKFIEDRHTADKCGEECECGYLCELIRESK